MTESLLDVCTCLTYKPLPYKVNYDPNPQRPVDSAVTRDTTYAAGSKYKRNILYHDLLKNMNYASDTTSNFKCPAPQDRLFSSNSPSWPLENTRSFRNSRHHGRPSPMYVGTVFGTVFPKASKHDYRESYRALLLHQVSLRVLLQDHLRRRKLQGP